MFVVSIKLIYKVHQLLIPVSIEADSAVRIISTPVINMHVISVYLKFLDRII